LRWKDRVICSTLYNLKILIKHLYLWPNYHLQIIYDFHYINVNIIGICHRIYSYSLILILLKLIITSKLKQYYYLDSKLSYFGRLIILYIFVNLCSFYKLYVSLEFHLFPLCNFESFKIIITGILFLPQSKHINLKHFLH
jgi:hypothetical protein